MVRILKLAPSVFVLFLLASCAGDATQLVEVTRLVPQTVQVTVLTTQAPTVPTALATSPAAETPGRLAFVSRMDGEVALYTINIDRTGLTRLSHEPMLIFNPAWSPDGTQIAFDACLGGDISTDCPEGESFDIYLVNADGSNLANLTQHNGTNRYPTWSPDGQIAFSSDRLGKEEIYAINADGSGLVQLTENSARNYEPKWSPDGKWLAYHCTQNLTTQICIQPSKGTGPVTAIAGTSPVWSPILPGGELRLAYHCWAGGRSDSDICLVLPDGSGIIYLADSTWDEISPAWSPDGQWIAYQSNQYDFISLYKTRLPGDDQASPSRLTGEEVAATRPAWSPDGIWIAFKSDEELYVTGADGGPAKFLAGKVFGAAAWQPSKGE